MHSVGYEASCSIVPVLVGCCGILNINSTGLISVLTWVSCIQQTLKQEFEHKRFIWELVEEMERPRVVNARVATFDSKDSLLAQVVVRMHTKQVGVWVGCGCGYSVGGLCRCGCECVGRWLMLGMGLCTCEPS